MQEFVKQLVEHYGYLAVYFLLAFGIIGLPIPDETMLIFVGFLIFKGTFSTLPAYACAIFGAISGITVSYLLGRTVGYNVIEKYGKYVHITEARLKRFDAFNNKFGQWVLVFGYFIPGVRHLSALSTGISKLEFKTFARFAYSGAVVWVCTFISLGYVLDKEWEKYKDELRGNLRIIAGVLIILVLVISWITYRQNRKKPRKHST